MDSPGTAVVRLDRHSVCPLQYFQGPNFDRSIYASLIHRVHINGQLRFGSKIKQRRYTCTGSLTTFTVHCIPVVDNSILSLLTYIDVITYLTCCLCNLLGPTCGAIDGAGKDTFSDIWAKFHRLGRGDGNQQSGIRVGGSGVL